MEDGEHTEAMDDEQEENSSDNEDEQMQDTSADNAQSDEGVYLPGQPLEKGAKLVCDESAYVLFHQAQTGAPCLSFDVIPDGLGENRTKFPHTVFIAAGTQAARTHVNNVIVMKMSNLSKTQPEESADENSSDEEDNNTEVLTAKLDYVMIKHQGCVNRIRVTPIADTVLVAAWSELGRVSLWDVGKQLKALNANQTDKSLKENEPPLYTFTGHLSEGFAVDWSSTSPGVLATGDCQRNIHVWKPVEGGTWNVDQRPLTAHTSSVEDVQWSPNEPNVLASCSVDKSIRVWDIRAAPTKACMLTASDAHESDVNVISWNRREPFIVSGGDDGMLKVWDLRVFQKGNAVAIFKHHTAPVTTVEWHPNETTVFASGGSDDQIALWDLAVEADTESTEEEIKDIPPQLLFIHQGQQDVKELHWHPQIPGLILSTAHSGFNVFKTISV